MVGVIWGLVWDGAGGSVVELSCGRSGSFCSRGSLDLMESCQESISG
jgi:hypothetical protein